MYTFIVADIWERQILIYTGNYSNTIQIKKNIVIRVYERNVIKIATTTTKNAAKYCRLFLVHKHRKPRYFATCMLQFLIKFNKKLFQGKAMFLLSIILFYLT